MRFLVDAQLPPALARWIEGHGHSAEHVNDRNMTSAADREIWDYASSVNATIVTKDEDFKIRRVFASRGPSVVWIRAGNKTTRELLEWIEPHFFRVIDALDRGERLVEIN